MTIAKTAAQYAGFSVGDTFVVTVEGDDDNYYHEYNVGDVIKFDYDDGTTNPRFTRISDGKVQFMKFDLIEQINLTPAGLAGLKIGSTYRMKGVNSEGYPAGTLVTFTEDDGTDMPRFDVPAALDASGWNFLHVSGIEPTPVKAPSTDVTFDDTVVTVPIEITIITVKRRLTTEEKDAISAIIN